jgi:RimJ/RimL family protein N-acetyltransferase
MTLPEPIPGPAYRITTARLVIRCMEPKDADLLTRAIEESLDHLLPWAFWAKQQPLTIQKRIELLREWRGNFDRSLDFQFGIFDPAESLVLGCARLNPHHGDIMREIGYWIHKDHINQGYATEVSAALTRVAFEIDHVTRVEIHCDPKNVRSAAVPRKLGFVHEATLHNRSVNTAGNLRHSMVWTLFQEDYPSSYAAKTSLQAFDAIGRIIL